MASLGEHLNWHWKQWRHRRLARAILVTPPATIRDDGVIVFSMIGSAVLLPYLVAVKSLLHHLRRGRVVILDDGTLTAADKAVLAAQLGDPRIIAIDTIATDPCPRRDVWERLLTILDLRAQDYVIQLDSDTVTLGPVPEVAAAIDAGRSFTLLGEGDARLLPVDAFVATRRAVDPLASATHVQDASEAVLDRVAVPGRESLRYVRGCAGFAGFTRSEDGRAVAETLSLAMDRILGERQWRRWGSEQVAANFVVANDAEPVLLPYNRYFNFWNAGVPRGAAFAHFIGTYRFHGTAYLRATRDAIRQLQG
ncbi:hypothetical protein [Sphingomonas lacusdianchii]|uniref:hypothetical protein n=1 Tax=Sphingomonas lacusdianchii TaxID=2917992 RepID=UPI001F56BF61|nr:hypothetical protein [Sphingomonas sp. JXJ CY 53]